MSAKPANYSVAAAGAASRGAVQGAQAAAAQSQPRPASVFAGAAYQASAAHWEQLPPDSGPEIAFAGRSNAGKSSAINALARRRRLAFVSKTPGRTQMINIFSTSSGLKLVDLPGYGFSRVPAPVRARWQSLLERYLTTRRSLVGMILVMDVRHPLTALDLQLLAWLGPTGRPLHVLLTKSDKLSPAGARTALTEVRRRLAQFGADASGPVTVQLFSSLTGAGIDDAEATVRGWIEARSSGEDAETEKKGP